MNGKVLVSAVSLILVVGVAIGTIAVVHKKNGEPEVVEHQKAVKTMCQNTEDQKLCHDTLSSVKDADPKAYLGAAVEATTNSAIKALNMSDRLAVERGSNSAGIKMALDDCKDLLQSALDSLEASANLLKSNNIQGISDQSPDFRNWLSSVISYQQSCMDGFDDDKDGEKEIKEILQSQGNLDEMGKLTGIALDIAADLSKILEQFGLKLDVKPASRRLLEVDSEGFPSWFSASDRKLLQKARRRGGHIKPNVVVAKDGSGNFKTIKEAIDSYPKGYKGRYVIHVKAGVYAEYIIVPKTAVNLLMYGDGPTRTIVTGNKNFVDGVKTMQTATFANLAPGFIAKYMGFENSAGPEKHQAVALRNQGDQSAFFDCNIHGYQDSLYVQTNRQFYRNCEISGTVDFIFGVSTTLIQNSKIVVRKPLAKQFNTVTADGRSQKNMPTGIVLQNCQIVPELALFPERFAIKTYLGRPWKAFSMTVVMESTLGDFIQPEGWIPWEGNMYLDTLYYAEFANTGPGADVSKRISWKGYHGLLSKNEAALFTVGQFLKGGTTSRSEDWMKPLHVPFDIGFVRP